MKLEPGRAVMLPGQRDGPDRLAAMLAFERVLEHEGDPRDNPGDQQSDGQRDGNSGDGSGPQSPFGMELSEADMSPDLLRLMNQSLMSSLGQHAAVGGGQLRERLLIGHITGGLRACKQVSCQDWRLSLRLDPVLLAHTVLQMTFRHGHFAVSIRTACGDAHQKLLKLLPDLNLALKNHGLPEQLAEVFLVSPGDIA